MKFRCKDVVHMRDVMRLSPIDSASVGNPSKGMVVFNSSSSKLQVYTGSKWETLTSSGA